MFDSTKIQTLTCSKSTDGFEYTLLVGDEGNIAVVLVQGDLRTVHFCEECTEEFRDYVDGMAGEQAG